MVSFKALNRRRNAHNALKELIKTITQKEPTEEQMRLIVQIVNNTIDSSVEQTKERMKWHPEEYNVKT
jgi:hypothetical protein